MPRATETPPLEALSQLLGTHLERYCGGVAGLVEPQAGVKLVPNWPGGRRKHRALSDREVHPQGRSCGTEPASRPRRPRLTSSGGAPACVIRLSHWQQPSQPLMWLMSGQVIGRGGCPQTYQDSSTKKEILQGTWQPPHCGQLSRIGC